MVITKINKMHSYKNLKDYVFTLPFDGINMVEANAGTGKTYNIVLLYVRAIIELKVEPEQILTVTFTRDATKDLKQRIYEGLNSFKKELSSYKKTKEWTNKSDITKTIVEQALTKGLSIDQISNRVDNAISNFYKASVYTIHGIANHLLSSYAIETNTPLSFELAQNESELLQQSIELELLDFIKKLENNTVQTNVIGAILDKITITDIKKTTNLLSALADHEFDYIEPPYYSEEQLFHRIAERDGNFLSLPPKNEVLYDLKKVFNPKNKHTNEKNRLIELYDKADQFIIRNKQDEDFGLRYLTKKKLIKSDEDLQMMPTILQIDEYVKDVRLISSFTTYLSFQTKKRLAILKRKDNILGYNDLVLNLSELLENVNMAKAMINKVHDKYKLVFIDEFQDTDPYQISIFSKLFTDTKKISLFTFGDPKQSIYSFRGADLASYVKANRQWEPNNYSLLENYRSTERLLSSVNTIFHNADSFMYDGISFQHSKFPLDKEASLHPGINVDHPVELVDIYSAKTSDYISTFCSDIAQEIKVILTTNKLELKSSEKQLNYNDFTILCDTNSQCKSVKKALATHGLNSLIIGGYDILRTTTAEDLFHLLNSVLNYTDRSSVNAFMLNPLILSSDITNKNKFETNFDNYRPLLLKAFEQWNNYGLEYCFDYLEDQFHISDKIGSLENAERILTDLNHVLEFLTEEEKQLHLKSHALINHFYFAITNSKAQDISVDSPTSQRLETDENLVNIMTTHKSKGLQFPVIFCPFIYPTSNKFATDYKLNKPYIAFFKKMSLLHITNDIENGDALAVSEDKRHQLKLEKIRRLYVAFTRAESKLYIYKNSHDLDKEIPKAYFKTAWSSLEQLNGHFWNHEQGFLLRGVNHNLLINNSSQIYVIPDKQDVLIKPKIMSRKISASWIKQSFSALTSNATSSFLDESTLNLNNIFYEQDLETLNDGGGAEFKGASFGSVVHDILEKCSFKDFKINNLDSSMSYHKMLNEIISEYFSIDKITVFNKLYAAVDSLIKNSVQVPFIGTKSLIDISDLDLVKEQEFVFDVQTNTLVNFLKEINSEYPEIQDITKALQNVTAPRIRINGFIDLLANIEDKWYIIDYKTNFLRGDYDQDSIFDSMKDHKYRLQYIIYTCAWVKFQRIIGMSKDDCRTNFGGAYYLYLRGMNTKKPLNGVFYDDLRDNGLFDKILNYFWES
jgi:exodeoxyribonuclease V beta subunit